MTKTWDSVYNILLDCPELDSITVIFNWKLHSPDLPTGITVGRTTALSIANILKAVENMTDYLKHYFQRVAELTVQKVQQGQPPQNK